MKAHQLIGVLAVLAATPSMAADVVWTLTGPVSVAAGQPVTWQASVAVTGANQGLAGYAYHIVVGPGPGPTPGPDGVWGTGDDANLAATALSPAAFVNSFQVAGSSPPPGPLTATFNAAGPGMNVLAQAGTGSRPGELLQVGSSYLDWTAAPAPLGQSAGVGLESWRSVLLADPAGSYVVNSGTIPTTGLAPGLYTAMLIPVATRTLRPDLNFSQNHAGFIMQPATAEASSFVFAVGDVVMPGDFDGDFDVDQDDLAQFIACTSGPDIPYVPPPAGCTLPLDGESRIKADTDRDGDVDQDDFGVLQRCYSGAGIPGHVNCAD